MEAWKNKVYNMDCLEGLSLLPDNSIDTILCDPPYGIDFQSARRTAPQRFDKIANDKVPFIEPLKTLPRVLKDTGCIYLFTRWDVQQTFIDELERIGIPAKSIIIWDKGNHSMGDLKREYGRRYESIIFAPCKDFVFKNGRPVDIINYPRVPSGKLCHPNEKPISLIQRLLRDSTPPNGSVLDFTMGSGTTILAAIREKMDYVGFEIDEDIFRLAEERIKNEKKQLRFNL